MNPQNKISRFKLQRRLMVELPGLGKSGALDRRPYPPGEHGQKRIKYSEHRLQLEEKQKIRIHYGLREEQLIKIVKKAKKSKSRWCETLVNLLEKRLDNIVFRGGFAPSIAAASQLISHGKILVNGKKVDIRSFTVKVSDEISLKRSAFENQAYVYAKQSPRLPLPDWLTKNESDSEASLTLNDEPNFSAVPFALDESLVTSYYSKVWSDNVMATILKENDISSFAIDSDSAVIVVLNRKYVLDYSMMVDLLTNLAEVTSLMENYKNEKPLETRELRDELH